MSYQYNRFRNIEDHASVLEALGHENQYFIQGALECLSEKCDYYVLKTKNQSGVYIVEYQIGTIYRQESSKGLTAALARAVSSLDAIHRSVTANTEQQNEESDRER